MSEVLWIKITTSMFEDEKIKLIRRLPEADAILTIWIQLICLAGKCNRNGNILISENIPYTDEMLSEILNRDVVIVRHALDKLAAFGMIIWENGKTLLLPNFERHQQVKGLEHFKDLSAARSQKYRLKKKGVLLLTPPASRDGHVLPSDSTSRDDNVTSRDGHVSSRADKNRIDIKENIIKEKRDENKNIFNLFEEVFGYICPVNAIEEMKDAENHYSTEQITEAFDKALKKGIRSWPYVRGILEGQAHHDKKQESPEKSAKWKFMVGKNENGEPIYEE